MQKSLYDLAWLTLFLRSVPVFKYFCHANYHDPVPIIIIFEFLLLLQIILRHEHSQPCRSQLHVQFMQACSAFQTLIMLQCCGLLIGNSVALFFPITLACATCGYAGVCAFLPFCV